MEPMELGHQERAAEPSGLELGRPATSGEDSVFREHMQAQGLENDANAGLIQHYVTNTPSNPINHHVMPLDNGQALVALSAGDPYGLLEMARDGSGVPYVRMLGRDQFHPLSSDMVHGPLGPPPGQGHGYEWAATAARDGSASPDEAALPPLQLDQVNQALERHARQPMGIASEEASRPELDLGAMKTPGGRVSKYGSKAILELSAAGYTQSKIAKETKTKPSTVRNVIHRARVPEPQEGMMTPRGGHVSGDGRAAILERVDEGKSAQKIAEETGIKASAVEHVIEFARVPRPKAGMMTPGGKRLTPLGRKEIEERTRAGESQRTIATNTGISASTVQRAIQYAKVPRLKEGMMTPRGKRLTRKGNTEILRLSKKKLPPQKIAESTGIKPGTVRSAIVRARRIAAASRAGDTATMDMPTPAGLAVGPGAPPPSGIAAAGRAGDMATMNMPTPAGLAVGPGAPPPSGSAWSPAHSSLYDATPPAAQAEVSDMATMDMPTPAGLVVGPGAPPPSGSAWSPAHSSLYDATPSAAQTEDSDEEMTG